MLTTRPIEPVAGDLRRRWMADDYFDLAGLRRNGPWLPVIGLSDHSRKMFGYSALFVNGNMF
jgi:hypothetical protein